LKRIEAIRDIMKTITTELVISSCGLISRELHSVKDRPENFYVMGSMGAALGIAIGLALNTDKEVIAIVGDGEILMSLGTLVLMNKLRLPNLKLYILDNNCYETTGGQKTISDAVNFEMICPFNCKVIKVETNGPTVPRIPIPHKELAKRFYDAVNSA
jgi:thiamine pyrophosphate-dependent acetolactate synthase large subunit-like protein